MLRDLWDSIEQFFRDHFDLLPTRHPVDYYMTLCGVASTVIFCIFLSTLLFRARRGNRTDYALAMVIVAFGMISGYSFYRLTHALSYIPYISPALWGFAVVTQVIATVCIVAELRHSERYD